MSEIDATAHPRMRPVEALPVRMNGQDMVCLRDPQGLAERPIFLNRFLVFVVSRMDGTNSLRDIQADIVRTTGEIFPMEDLEEIVRQLDEQRYLDSPAFQDFYLSLRQEFRNAAARPTHHAGKAYEASADALTRQLEGFFTHAEGPGLNWHLDPARPLRGLIAPHIDFHRGGPTYAHAYRALGEHPDVDCFILFGTCHHPMQQRFALTAKDFETPLGPAVADREFIGLLASKLKEDYFLDEFAHRGEHSIEFQAVCLRYTCAAARGFKIVPILVGSFQDICEQSRAPSEVPEVREMVQAVRETMAQRPAHYCILAGADLAHVGRQFGDPSGPTEASLREVEREDRNFLELVVSGDAEGMFRSIAVDNDRRRVCGYPAIYMTLNCLENPSGKLLQYRQWADLESGAAITFASVAFF